MACCWYRFLLGVSATLAILSTRAASLPIGDVSVNSTNDEMSRVGKGFMDINTNAKTFLPSTNEIGKLIANILATSPLDSPLPLLVDVKDFIGLRPLTDFVYPFMDPPFNTLLPKLTPKPFRSGDDADAASPVGNEVNTRTFLPAGNDLLKALGKLLGIPEIGKLPSLGLRPLSHFVYPFLPTDKFPLLTLLYYITPKPLRDGSASAPLAAADPQTRNALMDILKPGIGHISGMPAILSWFWPHLPPHFFKPFKPPPRTRSAETEQVLDSLHNRLIEQQYFNAVKQLTSRNSREIDASALTPIVQALQKNLPETASNTSNVGEMIHSRALVDDLSSAWNTVREAVQKYAPYPLDKLWDWWGNVRGFPVKDHNRMDSRSLNLSNDTFPMFHDGHMVNQRESRAFIADFLSALLPFPLNLLAKWLIPFKRAGDDSSADCVPGLDCPDASGHEETEDTTEEPDSTTTKGSTDVLSTMLKEFGFNFESPIDDEASRKKRSPDESSSSSSSSSSESSSSSSSDTEISHDAAGDECPENEECEYDYVESSTDDSEQHVVDEPDMTADEHVVNKRDANNTDLDLTSALDAGFASSRAAREEMDARIGSLLSPWLPFPFNVLVKLIFPFRTAELELAKEAHTTAGDNAEKDNEELLAKWRSSVETLRTQYEEQQKGYEAMIQNDYSTTVPSLTGTYYPPSSSAAPSYNPQQPYQQPYQQPM